MTTSPHPSQDFIASAFKSILPAIAALITTAHCTSAQNSGHTKTPSNLATVQNNELVLTPVVWQQHLPQSAGWENVSTCTKKPDSLIICILRGTDRSSVEIQPGQVDGLEQLLQVHYESPPLDTPQLVGPADDRLPYGLVAHAGLNLPFADLISLPIPGETTHDETHLHVDTSAWIPLVKENPEEATKLVHPLALADERVRTSLGLSDTYDHKVADSATFLQSLVNAYLHWFAKNVRSFKSWLEPPLHKWDQLVQYFGLTIDADERIFGTSKNRFGAVAWPVNDGVVYRGTATVVGNPKNQNGKCEVNVLTTGHLTLWERNSLASPQGDSPEPVATEFVAPLHHLAGKTDPQNGKTDALRFKFTETVAWGLGDADRKLNKHKNEKNGQLIKNARQALTDRNDYQISKIPLNDLYEAPYQLSRDYPEVLLTKGQIPQRKALKWSQDGVDKWLELQCENQIQSTPWTCMMIPLSTGTTERSALFHKGPHLEFAPVIVVDRTSPAKTAKNIIGEGGLPAANDSTLYWTGKTDWAVRTAVRGGDCPDFGKAPIFDVPSNGKGKEVQYWSLQADGGHKIHVEKVERTPSSETHLFMETTCDDNTLYGAPGAVLAWRKSQLLTSWRLMSLLARRAPKPQRCWSVPLSTVSWQ